MDTPSLNVNSISFFKQCLADLLVVVVVVVEEEEEEEETHDAKVQQEATGASSRSRHSSRLWQKRERSSSRQRKREDERAGRARALRVLGPRRGTTKKSTDLGCLGGVSQYACRGELVRGRRVFHPQGVNLRIRRRRTNCAWSRATALG
jgi:hypothetical protein